MAGQPHVSLQVRCIPMDQIQAAGWRASLLLLLDFIGEICIVSQVEPVQNFMIYEEITND
jgi:hypothetical protein